ncbi:MAG: peptide chain release factor N(5)-glutamine methyltransferase [Phycisphaerae bacterium]
MVLPPHMGEATEKSWTILELINWTKGYLARAGVEDARLSAEVLLAHVLGCPRIELYARFDHQPDPQKLAEYRELIRRASELEPVAYLVGHREFYSLSMKVTPDVLIPRPESEILVSEALNYLLACDQPPRMLDACTGCGCVAVATAVHVPQATVLATDISAPAVEVAAGNARLHNVADRVRCRTAELLEIPEDCRDMLPLDVITANPPYVAKDEEVAETVRYEPPVALYAGRSGLEFIRRIVADAPALLRIGGALMLEFGFSQADDVRDIIADSEHFDEPTILRDRQDLERTAVTIRVS